jgi:hypothetical protein
VTVVVPFDGEPRAVLAAHLRERPLLPRVDVAQLPPLLQRAWIATWAYENARAASTRRAIELATRC